MRGPPGMLPGLVLILVLLGAGSKAGLVPLHVWLPLAHPAAPSHVSALMSGVMTKVAVYGFIRIVFDLNGPPAWWWSIVVIPLAGVTCVLGVLSALMQHDIKRLLAYHTVENIGIIFIGLGLALAFAAHRMPAPPHLPDGRAVSRLQSQRVQEPAVFRRRRGADRDRRARHGASGWPHPRDAADGLRLPGGLCRDLGVAAAERVRFRVADVSGDSVQPDVPSWGIKLIVPAVGATLALSAALAAGCFVKAFGVTFLGRPRTPMAAKARETDNASLAAMFAFAALCLIAGIFPGFFIDALAPVAKGLVGGRMPAQSAIPWLSIVPIAESRSSYDGLLVFAFITVATLAAVEIIHRFASHTVRRGPAWACGFPDSRPANAIHRRQLRAADPARVRRSGVFRP